MKTIKTVLFVIIIMALVFGVQGVSAKPKPRTEASSIIAYRGRIAAQTNYQTLAPHEWNAVLFDSALGYGTFSMADSDRYDIVPGANKYRANAMTTIKSDGFCSTRIIQYETNGNMTELGVSQAWITEGFAVISVTPADIYQSYLGSFLELQVMCDNDADLAGAHLYLTSQ